MALCDVTAFRWLAANFVMDWDPCAEMQTVSHSQDTNDDDFAPGRLRRRWHLAHLLLALECWNSLKCPHVIRLLFKSVNNKTWIYVVHDFRRKMCVALHTVFIPILVHSTCPHDMGLTLLHFRSVLWSSIVIYRASASFLFELLSSSSTFHCNISSCLWSQSLWLLAIFHKF